MKAVKFRINRLHFTVSDLIALVIFLILLIVILFSFHDYGISFDEGVQEHYGNVVLKWYLSLGDDREALTYSNLYFYGGAFDLMAALFERILPFSAYDTRHLLNGLVGLVGVIGGWRLGRYVGGPSGGLLSALLLILMPSWYGMMFINPKDIPFAAGMCWSLYFIARLADQLPKPSWGSIVKLGVAIGLTLGVRVGGVLAFGYLGVALMLHLLAHRPMTAWTAMCLPMRLATRIVLPIFFVAWLVMLLFWPYAQVAPLTHPLESIRHFDSFSPDIDTLFFGQEANDAYRPILYLPVYLLIKMPEVDVLLFVVAAMLAIVAAWRAQMRRINSKVILLLTAIAIPLLYVAISRPELYDAERHFLFLLPPIAVACAIACRSVIRGLPRSAAAVVVGAIALTALAPLPAMSQLHPYEYAYYNAFVGGLSGVIGEFETEYWGTALSEAARQLRGLLPEGGITPIKVGVCGEGANIEEPLKGIANVVDDWRTADYIIATTRNHCDDAAPGKIISKVSRDGADFAVIKDVRGQSRSVAANGMD